MAEHKAREASREACDVFAVNTAARLEGISRSSDKEAIEASRTPGIWRSKNFGGKIDGQKDF
jgi:hypothetical protein